MSLSRKGLLVLCPITMVLSVAVITVSTLGLYTSVLHVLPSWIFTSSIVVSIGVGGLMTLGFVGAYRTNKVFLWIFTIFAIATIMAQAVLTALMLLFANDVATISSLDTLVSNTQVALELELIDYGYEYPQEWLDTQLLFDCCGVDLQATYMWRDLRAKSVLDYLKIQLSNPKCVTDFTTIDEIHARFLIYSSSAEELGVLMLGDDFFCKGAIRNIIIDRTTLTAIISGVILLLLVAAVNCAVVLSKSNRNQITDKYIREVNNYETDEFSRSNKKQISDKDIEEVSNYEANQDTYENEYQNVDTYKKEEPTKEEPIAKKVVSFQKKEQVPEEFFNDDNESISSSSSSSGDSLSDDEETKTDYFKYL